MRSRLKTFSECGTSATEGCTCARNLAARCDSRSYANAKPTSCAKPGTVKYKFHLDSDSVCEKIVCRFFPASNRSELLFQGFEWWIVCTYAMWCEQGRPHVCENKLKSLLGAHTSRHRASSANYIVRRRGEILICIIDTSVNKNDQIAPSILRAICLALGGTTWACVIYTNMRREREEVIIIIIWLCNLDSNGSQLLL